MLFILTGSDWSKRVLIFILFYLIVFYFSYVLFFPDGFVIFVMFRLNVIIFPRPFL